MKFVFTKGMTVMRLAIIDIGSNTIRGEVWDISASGCSRFYSRKVTAGLIGFVREGRLSDGGSELLVKTLLGFREEFYSLGIPDGDIHPFATAALRAVDNSGEIIRLVSERTGLAVRVLSGAEEAGMGLRAMRMQFPGAREGLLTDIGGGSTEITAFSGENTLFAQSLPIGSLTLRDGTVRNAIPEIGEIEAMSAKVRAALDGMGAPRAWGEGYAIGGGARNLALAHMAWRGADAPLAGYALPLGDLRLMTRSLTPRDWLELIVPIAPERVHTLLPCAAIMLEVFSGFPSVTTVTGGVREGFIMSLLAAV